MSPEDAPSIPRVSAPEHRDDLETFTSETDSRTGIPFGTVLDVPSGNFNCRVSSICQSIDIASDPKEDKAVDRGEEQNENEAEEEAIDRSKQLNDTMMDFQDERLDLNSVLSGTMEEEEATAQMQGEDYSNGVSVKNLSKLFEENDEINRRMNAENATTSKSGGQSSTNRPPLAPPKANTMLKSEEGTVLSIPGISKSNEEKRLSVFLRIRPPVSATGKEGVDGSISTIEVLADKSNALPSTIRTYPPTTSNAAKVVRAGNKLAPLNLKKIPSSKSLTDDGSSDSGGDSTAEVLGVKEYSYSGVFGPNSTQNDIYQSVAAPLVDGLFQDKSGELGESALLFTLGVTNAGKTHTVMGTGFEKKKSSDRYFTDSSPHRDWGIIPRSLHHMLSRINNLNALYTSRPKLQLYMSYLEIYNEQIFDLLPDKTNQAPRRPCVGPNALKLRESRRGRIFVRGLARHPINNVQEGLELALEAKKNRHTASNNINANSSRSHSICQFEIAHFRAPCSSSTAQSDIDNVSEYDTDDDSSVSSVGSKKGRNSTIIWIVDLAGSERSKRTGAISHTRHQKEAALINASLMNLMRCLREMLNHQPKKRGATKGGVVPFRESKLTHMFMNHLTGPSASRTSMIVNVNPAADDFDETQHVLSYAATARNVKISAVDYNKKRRILAKESNVKLSPVKKFANLVQKLSPKKRKGSGDSKPDTKRLRSNAGPKYNETKKPLKEVAICKKPLSEVGRGKWDRNDVLENLREENFSLKITIDDLEQQLADCEADVRAEVVEMMNEQLQDSKEWYEGRIENLKQQLDLLEASNSKQAHHDADAQAKMNDLFDRINECEEEMKRMREEHEAEMEDKSSELLNMANMHQAEMEQATLVHEDELLTERAHKEKLLEENGALRHQAAELRASHDTILSKYNELLSLYQQQEKRRSEQSNVSYEPLDTEDHESTQDELGASSFKKLPRDRCSDVASTAASVEIVSPKGKGGKWGFLRSPAKVALGEKSDIAAKSRSPLGKLNPNLT